MKINRRSIFLPTLMMALLLIIANASTRLRADRGSCGGATSTLPFTDVMGNPFFCQIAEAFFSGLTNGTTATTYSPAQNVTRDQMAALVTRTLDQSLKRGSRRAALKQFWSPTSQVGLGLTQVGSVPEEVASDGADLWVANLGDNTVSRVRASDGKLLGTWTQAINAIAVLSAKGSIFVVGNRTPGTIYQIDPTQPAGDVSTLTTSVGDFPIAIAFDGSRIWTANELGSVSIVTLNPLSVATVTSGFTEPFGIVYDGLNMWVSDIGPDPGKLFKLDSNGAIIQAVDVGTHPGSAVFDGTNIWVPYGFSPPAVSVVRASTGTVIATLTGNGLSSPFGSAFDGERVLVTSRLADRVSLWKAADLSPLGFVITGSNTKPMGACSDGLNFWITLDGINRLARF